MIVKPCDKWDNISSSIESKQHLKKTENLHLKVGSSYINSSMPVRNLGLILDNTLGMDICKSCYCQIRNIGRIRKYINDETCKSLVQAVIISRLDYGNALPYNIFLSLTKRLQRVQNCASRVVTHTRKRGHITPFKITVQYPISYIQSTEWNSTIVSK